MSRINTNIPSIVAQRQLTVSQRSLGLSLERLSSGLRINRGADDPAGLIVSERLRAEISAIIAERAIEYLEAPIARVAGFDTPFPYTLEHVYLPDAGRILNAIDHVVNF